MFSFSIFRDLYVNEKITMKNETLENPIGRFGWWWQISKMVDTK